MGGRAGKGQHDTRETLSIRKRKRNRGATTWTENCIRPKAMETIARHICIRCLKDARPPDGGARCSRSGPDLPAPPGPRSHLGAQGPSQVALRPPPAQTALVKHMDIGKNSGKVYLPSRIAYWTQFKQLGTWHFELVQPLGKKKSIFQKDS